MVDKDLISIKLGELSLRLERARSHCPPTVEELAGDDDALDIVAFNLMLAMQSALDLASHIIADEGWEPASNLAESFRRLGERAILSRDTVEAMARGASLRNLVAHGYSKIDVAKVHRAATEGTRELDRFAAEVAKWVAAT